MLARLELNDMLFFVILSESTLFYREKSCQMPHYLSCAQKEKTQMVATCSLTDYEYDIELSHWKTKNQNDYSNESDFSRAPAHGCRNTGRYRRDDSFAYTNADGEFFVSSFAPVRFDHSHLTQVRCSRRTTILAFTE